jgi:hypothetical protein
MWIRPGGRVLRASTALEAWRTRRRAPPLPADTALPARQRQRACPALQVPMFPHICACSSNIETLRRAVIQTISEFQLSY